MRSQQSLEITKGTSRITAIHKAVYVNSEAALRTQAPPPTLLTYTHYTALIRDVGRRPSRAESFAERINPKTRLVLVPYRLKTSVIFKRKSHLNTTAQHGDSEGKLRQ